MADWHIRRAVPGDAEALTSCIDAAYTIYDSRGLDLPDVSADIAEDITSHRVWIGELDGSVAGGIVLVPKDDHLIVANVAVDPAKSGQGLGGALMARAEADCLALGLRELRLNTHIGIPENVALYAHLGWQETGRSGNKVTMRKLL